MMLRFSCIPPLVLSVAAYAESDIKRYLKTVYPTSQTIAHMSDAAAERYYNQLHFWYRVPSPQYPDGLLSKAPKVLYNTFLQSDLVATGEAANQEGFPNAKYLEVASYGFLPFHAGAYYYWSPGSGIFLNTEGSTLVAYNKIHMLYKLSGKSKNDFITELENAPMVQLQTWGKSQAFDQTMLKEICDNHDAYYFVKEFPDTSQGPSLLGSLRSSPQWPSIHAQLCRSNVEQAKAFLLGIYLEDHIEGKYQLTNPRYGYFVGEANEEIDVWLYDLARKKKISVVQLTRMPNNYPNLGFEIMDARWPSMSYKTTTVEQLKKQWQEVVSRHLLQLRDPFHLHDDRFAKDITLSFPSLTQFDQLDDWFNERPCPAPLHLEKSGCHFLRFAIDNSGNGGFSMTNIEHNVRLFQVGGRLDSHQAQNSWMF